MPVNIHVFTAIYWQRMQSNARLILAIYWIRKGGNWYSLAVNSLRGYSLAVNGAILALYLSSPGYNLSQ